MFYIIGDLAICGGYTYTGLKNWKWTGTQESLILDRKGSGGKDIDPDMKSPHGVEQEAGFFDPSDHPMPGVSPRVETKNVNQSSIACMVIWPEQTKANVSHYLGGDLGEGIEQMVLKWSAVPDETNNNHWKPTKCPAMKTSHYGSKKSTPMELLYTFDSEYIVVSNSVRTDWNHLSRYSCLYLESTSLEE